MVLEVEHHAEVQVEQIGEAVLGDDKIFRVLFDQVRAHKPEKIGIQDIHCLLFNLEVVCDFLGLLDPEVLDALHTCPQNLLEQEGLDELVEVFGLSAECKDALYLLLDLLIALLLADLEHLDDGSVELHVQEL